MTLLPCRVGILAILVKCINISTCGGVRVQCESPRTTQAVKHPPLHVSKQNMALEHRKIFLLTGLAAVILLLSSSLQTVSGTATPVRAVPKLQARSLSPLLARSQSPLSSIHDHDQLRSLNQAQPRHAREFGVLQTQKRGVESPRALGLLTITAILAIPLIIIFIILLFLPIPVAISTARMAREIVTSDECLERVACEALRFSREMEYDAKWVQKFFRSSRRNAIWLERVSRGLHTAECGALACDPITAFRRKLE